MNLHLLQQYRDWDFIWFARGFVNRTIGRKSATSHPLQQGTSLDLSAQQDLERIDFLHEKKIKNRKPSSEPHRHG